MLTNSNPAQFDAAASGAAELQGYLQQARQEAAAAEERELAEADQGAQLPCMHMLLMPQNAACMHVPHGASRRPRTVNACMHAPACVHGPPPMQPIRLPMRPPEYTPAWRGAGLPSKPSRLHLEPSKTGAAALLDPGSVLGALAAARGARVLSPPRVFEYADDTLEPHHLQTTGNLKVCVLWGRVCGRERAQHSSRS